ncbi:hypothetical protein B0I35DRAFT_423361 [Stachybotrys elegans]|uniref:Secreted protein n=1 Tax=Stachybotrys elegans TaxID=80388 RepID=A0A8K0T578_9HYPO|nr:hypothetical protein B0I35DRAFT_423361 [Stachybotrys elegans]
MWVGMRLLIAAQLVASQETAAAAAAKKQHQPERPDPTRQSDGDGDTHTDAHTHTYLHAVLRKKHSRNGTSVPTMTPCAR